MGGGKQLMPWPSAGDEPLVAAAFDAIAGVCGTMLVVVGHEAEAVVAALGARRFETVASDPDAEMFESIRAGLGAARSRSRAPGAAVLLHPADHPRVAPATLESILAVAGTDGGLRQFWIDHPDLCVRLPVDDPAVVRDLDTPDQWPGA